MNCCESTILMASNQCCFTSTTADDGRTIAWVVFCVSLNNLSGNNYALRPDL